MSNRRKAKSVDLGGGYALHEIDPNHFTVDNLMLLTDPSKSRDEVKLFAETINRAMGKTLIHDVGTLTEAEDRFVELMLANGGRQAAQDWVLDGALMARDDGW